jgi:pentatricopeptide repeat protein
MFNFGYASRVTPNRVCCNALLAAYARAKPPQWHKALHLLRAMWGGGPTLTPDPVSYNTAIKACAGALHVDRALEVFREMAARGVQPNLTTFNTLIAAAADAGHGGALREVGGWLDAAAPDVCAACTNAFVAALVKVGEWEEALARFADMLRPASAVRPTAATFNAIMAGHMRAGDYPAVRRSFDDMMAAGLAPSIVTHNTLLAALAAQGAWGDALDALSAVLSSAGAGVNANTATCECVRASPFPAPCHCTLGVGGRGSHEGLGPSRRRWRKNDRLQLLSAT